MTAKTVNQGIEELARQAKAGDRDAFSQIVRAMMNKVVALTYRMTGDRDAGLDLAQDAFVSAWENLASFKGEAKFTSWLYRIAANKCLNYLKRPAAREVTGADQDAVFAAVEAPETDNPERVYHQNQLRDDVAAFLGELPPGQKAAFELRHYQQMSFAEVSRVMGKAEGTVKTHYRLAVAKLRDYMKQKGYRS